MRFLVALDYKGSSFQYVLKPDSHCEGCAMLDAGQEVQYLDEVFSQVLQGTQMKSRNMFMYS